MFFKPFNMVWMDGMEREEVAEMFGCTGDAAMTEAM